MSFTMAGLVRELAAKSPESPAFTMDNHTITFGEFHERSSRAANGLIAQGIQPADRIAILDKNCVAYYEMIFGAAKAGAVLVAVNFRLAEREVDAILADAGVAFIVVGDEFRDLLPARPDIPVIVLGPEYETWISEQSTVDPGLGTDPEAVVLQLYSSGTTGLPKGIMLTSANLSWSPKMGAEYYQMSASSVNLVTSPLFHIGGTGYSMTTIGLGGHTVLVRNVNPVELLALISKYHVTHAFLVPTIIQMVLDALEQYPTDISSLHLIAYGGSPIPGPMLLEAMKVLGCSFLGVYGMTETAGSVLCLIPADHDPGGPRQHLLKSVGRTLSWHDVRVFNPDTGVECDAGEDGEIWVHSKQNMVGYWRQPELTRNTLSADGWLRTGDAGMMDAQGYIYMRDRLKDMIISGGENIYPVEVEQVLCQHPSVAEVVVIGVADPRWVESVKALVVLKPEAEVTGEELIEFCRLSLARYKCPRSIDFVDVLPRNASGKVLKRVLRDRYTAASQNSVG